MPAVVQQRQKAGVEATQWSYRKDHVQQKQGCRAKCSYEQRLWRGIAMHDCAQPHEQRQVKSDTGGDDCVVNSLLTRPADGPVGDTHGASSVATIFCQATL